MKSYHTHVKILNIVIVFMLSICLFLRPLIVYAKDDTASEHPEYWNDDGSLTVGGQIIQIHDLILYNATQTGALLKGFDFSQYLQNRENFIDYWNPSNITVDEATGTVTFSEDLVKYVKDMLLQYQIETSGFIYYPTVSYKDISAALYSSKNAYDSVKNLCEAHGLVAFLGKNNRIMFYPFSSKDLSENSFVFTDTYDKFLELEIAVNETFVAMYNNETWSKTNFKRCDYTDLLNSAITADGNYTIVDNYPFEYFTPVNVTKQLFTGDLIHTTGVRKSSLLSKDGRKIKIYMGLDSFKNNTAGTRSVYLTQDFYDDTVTSLAINMKSMAKFQEGYYKKMLEAINNSGLTDKQYDDLLEAIKDIESSEGMTEDELEKILQGLVDQVLEAIENSGSEEGGGSGNGGSGSGGSPTDVSGIESLLASILDTLSAGFTSVTEAIFSIDTGTDVEISVSENDIGNVLDDLDNDLSITENLENIVNTLKDKFPFSIPWDVRHIFASLASASSPQAYSMRPAVYYDDSGGSSETTDGSAPIWKIPVAVASAGIHEEFVIDLSDFAVVSRISRSLLTLYFCYGLINFTIKIVGLWKGGNSS